jgi:flagellar biosynthesis GTPase FlhF
LCSLTTDIRPTCLLTLFVFHVADDYSKHTSCVSEAERYEKSVYRGGKDKKKKNPQETWMDLIASASTTAPVSIRDSLKMLASLDNVPRKPKQFRNFTANSLNLRGNNDIVDSMWKHLSQLRDKEQEAKKEKEEEQKRQKEEEDAQEKSLDKREKLSVSANGKEPDYKKDKVTSKRVEKAMKKVLKKAPNRTLKLKELRRAVRNHLECDGSEKVRVKEIIGEQIKVAIDRIKVDGKLVTLR